MTLEKMIHCCTNLTPMEHDIADYVITHEQRLLHSTIQELSEELFVSKSAIHRFCRKLGFQGYKDLKLAVARDSTERMEKDELINVNYPFQMEDGPKEIALQLVKLYELTIRDTLEFIRPDVIQEIAAVLNQAQVIDVYSHSHNLNAAQNFHDKMLTIGKCVQCPQDFYEQRLQALACDEHHVAMILSYSGKAFFIEPLVKKLFEKRIPIVLIGKAGSNHYPQYIHYHVEITDKENLQDRISQFSSHIAMQYMLDVIFGCIYNQNRLQNMEYLRASIGFMDDRDIERERIQHAESVRNEEGL